MHLNAAVVVGDLSAHQALPDLDDDHAGAVADHDRDAQWQQVATNRLLNFERIAPGGKITNLELPVRRRHSGLAADAPVGVRKRLVERLHVAAGRPP